MRLVKVDEGTYIDIEKVMSTRCHWKVGGGGQSYVIEFYFDKSIIDGVGLSSWRFDTRKEASLWLDKLMIVVAIESCQMRITEIEHNITIKFNQSQNDWLMQKVQKSGLSVSEYIKRTLLLRYRTPEIEKLLKRRRSILSKSSLDEIELAKIEKQIGWLPTAYSLEDDETSHYFQNNIINRARLWNKNNR